MFGLFVAWYAFNAVYNVSNASCKVFAFPITIAILQLFIGLAYALPLWILGIRPPPKLTFADLMQLLPIVLPNAPPASVPSWSWGVGTVWFSTRRYSRYRATSLPYMRVLLKRHLTRIDILRNRDYKQGTAIARWIATYLNFNPCYSE